MSDSEDALLLDAHTLKDLEIFGAGADAKGLFDHCNFTRTPGGAEALKRRMLQPWRSVQRIRQTQSAVQFILEHRGCFSALSSEFATSRSDHYLREVLPVVEGQGVLAFSVGAFSIWANHGSHYFSIVRGVHLTAGIVQTLRRFVAQPELQDLPASDLSPILSEMTDILQQPGLMQVPTASIGSAVWTVLRLDQIFRAKHKASIARLLTLIYELDALVSMADATDKHGFTIPEVIDGPLMMEAESVTHPFLSSPIANPVSLHQQRRVLFLTGPNMAGKTTYLRAVATTLYLAQLGMGVPARGLRFSPADCLFSSISLNDDLRAGVSYFRAEAMRVRVIAEAIAEGRRVFAVLDEPFKGTNIKDAMDASAAMLSRFAARQNCLFLFSSHLLELGEELGKTEQVDFRFFEAEEDAGQLQFDYELRAGISSQRLGMRVLAEEGVFELLDDT